MTNCRPLPQFAMIVLLCGAACAAKDEVQPATDRCRPIEEIDEYASIILGGQGEPSDPDSWINAIEEDGSVQVVAFFYRECVGNPARRVCTAKLDGKQVVVTTARYTDTCDDTGGTYTCEIQTTPCGDFQLAPGAYELVYDHCKTKFTVPGFWVQCN